MASIDVRRVPPCRTCGSSAIKENNLKIDYLRGCWKGEWTCENGHRNILK